MRGNLRLQQPSGSAIAFVEIQGDPKQPEPEAIELRFPWGSVGVTRVTDGERPDYWVHVTRNHPNLGSFIPGETKEGRIVDARLDICGKHSHGVDIGEFANPGLYHLAVRMGPQ